MPAELAFALAAIQEGSRVGERRQVPGMEAGRSEAYLRFLPCQMVQGFSPSSDGNGAPFLHPAARTVLEYGGSKP